MHRHKRIFWGINKRVHHKHPYLRTFFLLFVIPLAIAIILATLFGYQDINKKTNATYHKKIQWLSTHPECELEPKSVIPPQLLPRNETTIRTPIDDRHVSLTLWDQNTWGGIFSFGTQERMKHLAEVVKNRHLVTLQEVFTSQALRFIPEKSAHPYFEYPGKGKSILKRTGLGILSKYRVVRSDYKLFSNATSFDKIANKGIFFLRLEHPQLGIIDVYTTHLQASYRPFDFSKTRDAQVEELIAFIKKNSREFLTIITGDFNFEEEDPSYKKMIVSLNLVDVVREMHPDKSYKLITHHSLNKRLDYIFMRLPENWNWNKNDSSAEILDLGLSDHMSVCAKIAFDKK